MVKKIFLNKKGFVITIDSFLSITLVAIFVMLAFGYLSLIKLDSWNSIDLKNSSSDLISILDKTNTFQNALLSSSTEGVSSILNSTPNNICFESTVFNSDSTIVLHLIKTGCTKDSTQVYSVERSIVLNDNGNVSFFIARIEGWFK
jgi:hypothetical protein